MRLRTRPPLLTYLLGTLGVVLRDMFNGVEVG